jgi:AcrR family transcriptional regulator
MTEIAEEAGFTAASLYTYFPSKKAIFRELGELVHEELTEVLATDVQPGASLADELTALLTSLLGWVERRRGIFQVFFALQWSGEPDLARDPGEATQPDAFGIASERLIALLRRHPVPGRDAEHLALALLGLVDSFVKAWVAQPDRPLGEVTPLIVDLFLNGALGGRA